MADFRRWILALAALVLVFGLVAPASAQSTSFTCSSAASVTPDLRHEGLDELVGDVILTCSGGTPTPAETPIPQGNFQVNLSLPFTSRLLSGNISEALLLVDNPSPANQLVCNSPNNPAVACQVEGDGGLTFNNAEKYNVFQGINSSVPGQQSLVTFLGVPVDPPMSAAVPRIYRITNLRVNASGAALLQTVFAFVSVSSSTSVPINPPQQAVGVVENGLTVTAKSTNPNFLQCQSYGTTQVGSVNFTENFATAFKILTNGVQNIPGTVYNSESGLEVVTAVGTTGTATTGTQLAATISNIPSGVTIYVDNWAQSTAAVCAVDEAGASCTLPSDATLVTSKSTEPPADPSVNTITAVTDGTESSVTVYW